MSDFARIPETPIDGPLGYYVNLDERGMFRADVRDPSGESVYEIECEGDDWSIFEHGWMENKADLDGLHGYLVYLGIATEGAELLHGTDFEDRIADDARTLEADPLEEPDF